MSHVVMSSQDDILSISEEDVAVKSATKKKSKRKNKFRVRLSPSGLSALSTLIYREEDRASSSALPAQSASESSSSSSSSSSSIFTNGYLEFNARLKDMLKETNQKVERLNTIIKSSLNRLEKITISVEKEAEHQAEVKKKLDQIIEDIKRFNIFINKNQKKTDAITKVFDDMSKAFQRYKTAIDYQKSHSDISSLYSYDSN